MRQLTKHDIKEHLEERIRQDRFQKLSDLPGPEAFEDMEKAVNRIVEALQAKELITVVGDYDVDGVVATTIMSEFFESIGANFESIIPNRFADGYGVSESVLKRCKGSLVITVDNGITAIESAELCKEKEIDLIITDHHEPKAVLPDAYAIINPKKATCTFPYEQICGAQVAWYVCAGIKKALGITADLSRYLDILALAIIADVMPMQEINRSLVKAGLKYLADSRRPAVGVLKNVLNKRFFTSEDVAFYIVPRLNAAGRMESAEIARDFLLAKNDSEAIRYFHLLDGLNQERKSIEQEVLVLAETQVDLEDNVLVVWGEGWHEGTVGIVAARLAEKYEKPAIVLSVIGDEAKGSARSFANINILELIQKQAEYLIGFGGHKGAAGLRMQVQNLAEFKKAIKASFVGPEEQNEELESGLLGILPYVEIDQELLCILDQFEPYGEAAPKPKFLSREGKIKECKIVGKEMKHTSFLIQDESCGALMRAIAFRQEHHCEVDAEIEFSFSVARSSFRNQTFPQLIIERVFKYK